MNPESHSTAAELVDAYLVAFRNGTTPTVAGRAMADGYLLDDGNLQFIAPSAVPTRIADLRSATTAEGEQLESWDLSNTISSGAVAVVQAELRWRSEAALRTQHIGYVVRTAGATARIIAVVVP